MQYIAFDFETSGLPEGRPRVVTKETLNCFDSCRGVSLSGARFSSRGRLIDTFDAIISPDDFTISQESINIHGITNEMATTYGKPFTEVFTDFMKFVGSTKILVAHNAKFDSNVLRSEIIRHKLNMDTIKDVIFRCTHEMYKEKFLKTIKLGDLYENIFGERFENAHNSLADCIACGRVYPYLLGHERQLKPINIPKIIIPASSVSTAIGLGFKRQPELIEELWKKYSPSTFDGKTREQVALEIFEDNPSSAKILKDALEFKSNSSSEVEQKVRAVYHQIENVGLKPKDVIFAKEYLRQTLHTKHGTRNEDKTASEDGANLIRDDTFYTYDICTIEGTLYQIVGRVDRIQLNDNGTRTLVEIKNRTRGLFKRVRDYEEVQCQTYLQMIKNIEYCRLIEQYDVERRAYLIERNDEKWNDTILPKLQNFCELFHSMLSEC